MDAGQILKEARRRAGLTQREVARRSATSHSAIAAYESGAKNPTVKTLDRLCRALGFEVTTRLEPIPTADLSNRGEELAEVLALADAFPSRPSRTLRFPPFPHSRAAG